MKDRFSATSLAAGVILGAILTAAWFLGGIAPPPSDSSLQADAASPPVATSSASGAISVTDQPAGSVVTVDSLTVPPPGVWVAVREVSAGDLGNVLGAARVGGPHTNVTVSLLRDTLPGRTYAVELYRDDGNGAFDLSTDSVYVDFDTGERVVAYFKTLASAE